MDFEFKNFPNFIDQGPSNCAEQDPELFFPEYDQPNFYQVLNYARNVCQGCPYQLACLEFAVRNNEPGVWGGTSELERRQMKNRGRIQLPTPKIRKTPQRWSGKAPTKTD